MKNPLAAALALLVFLGIAVIFIAIPRKVQRFFSDERLFSRRGVPNWLPHTDYSEAEWFPLMLRVFGVLSLIPIIILTIMFLRWME